MGVTGLLPFLKKSTDQINVNQFAGMTAAIDAYVWLHRGAFSCADKLARGENTTAYIYYGIKMLNLLLSHNIKPILVFDGRRLEAKKETESKRYELRKQNRLKAEELLQAGRENEARDYMRRSVDITHTMAIEFIRAARKMQVDCIVAPHEADAQLAFLNHQGIAQFVITEDSDLILFGCNMILYKLDPSGNGMLLRMDRLSLSLGRPHDPPQTLLTKLRHICILSGCDYVNSLPGVGLVKAKKFIMASSDPDICRSLKRLPLYLNLKAKIDDKYVERVKNAELTFQRQLVFNPRTRIQVTMDGEEVTNDKPYSGEYLNPHTALHLSLGNIDPFTMQQVDNFDPDTLPATSIWHKNFEPYKTKEELRVSAFITTKAKEVIVHTKNIIPKSKPATENFSSVVTDQELISMYSTKITQRRVMKTEIKSYVFDGVQNKEVRESSYFSKKKMKIDSNISTNNENLNRVQETDLTKVEYYANKKSPKKISRDTVLNIIDDNSSSEVIPEDISSTEIMTMIDVSPTKSQKDLNPISSNPFAKTDTCSRKSPQAINMCFLNNIEISHATEYSKESFIKSIDENVSESLETKETQLTYSEDEEQEFELSQEVSISQSSGGSAASQSDSQFDKFRYKRPLFKMRTDTDSSREHSPTVPKSPILGKRKRNENESQCKEEVFSSYFNNVETTSSSTTRENIASGDKRLSSLLQWGRTSPKTQGKSMTSLSSSPSSTTHILTKRHSIGLSKITKVSGQSSLYKFGFSKK